MEPITVEKTIQLELRECAECGAFTALPPKVWENAIREGKFYTCPNGHSRGWGDTEEKRQRKRAEAAEAEVRRLAADCDGLLAKVAEQGKSIKHIVKRANAGVCLHCHRTFQQLARHMATKHPEETL